LKLIESVISNNFTVTSSGRNSVKGVKKNLPGNSKIKSFALALFLSFIQLIHSFYELYWTGTMCQVLKWALERTQENNNYKPRKALSED
jgi:hypothetical protein